MNQVYSTADAQQDIVNAVWDIWDASDFSDVPLHGVNGPAAELDKLDRVANFEIEFRDSEQVTIGARPIDRTWGSIEFHFGTRKGRGVRSLLVMQSFVKEALKAERLGLVRTLIPSPGRTKEAGGWVFETLYVPFYFDGAPIANTHEP